MKAENNRISELIVRVQSGDKSAFEELYKLTSPKAYFVALKICKNEHDAEDILQESYIKALEKIDTVDPEGNFTAWLYQIVANRSKNLIKAKKPLLFSEDEEKAIGSLPDENLSFSPEEKVDQEELRSEVMAAVDELTAEKRACVMMMYFADMSVIEIAQSLEVPVSTVKNRLFTARKDLKNKFEKKGITAIYSAAPLGVVIWALGKSGETTAAAFAVSASSAVVLTGIGASSSASTVTTAATAAVTSSTAAATGTGIAAKVAALSVAQKVVAGVAAVSVIGGGATGVVTVVKNNMPEETTLYIEEVTTAPSQTEEFAFAVIPTEESTTETTTTISEPTATTSKPADKETSNRTQASTTERITSTSKTTAKVTTTKKPTTTKKETTTQNQTTTQKATTTKNQTTTKPTTTKEETTTRPTTTQPTTAEPTTAEPTTQAPATVTVEVMDTDENIVDTLTLSVPAGTEMTWEYLVSQIKSKGYEPQAGIYGDAVGAVAEAGATYNITAEL